MPRIVERTLWFEDTGLHNQPVIDTPFGRLSLRQTAWLATFALLGYFASTLIEELMLKIAVGGSIFLFGSAIFIQPVKTVSPERYLLLIFGIGSVKPRNADLGGKNEKIGAVKSPDQSDKKKVVRVSASFRNPVKIIGVLRDPYTGEPLKRRNFDFLVEGRRYSSGVTDEEGFFTVFFFPQKIGVYTVSVMPDGYQEDAQRFEVRVESGRF